MSVGDEIAAELGIPIVNKRVSVTPISLIGAATDATDYVVLALISLRGGVDLWWFLCLGTKRLSKGIRFSSVHSSCFG